jgi:hypothetical protein
MVVRHRAWWPRTPIRGRYTDGLNEVFTPGGWTTEYSVHVVEHAERIGKDKKVSIAAKVTAVCKLTILGLGAHGNGRGVGWQRQRVHERGCPSI